MRQPSDAVPVEPAAPTEPTSDRELVRRVQGGDLEAYDELVRRHIGRANLIARRLLHNREDAEDLVQDAFMRALDRIALFDLTYEFAPWFNRLLTNLGLNSIQSRKRRQTEPAEVDLPSEAPGPAIDAERSEIRDRVAAAVATLPPRQRLIVGLFEVDGLDTAEIAAQLEVTPETVRWHLHQARRALRVALSDLRGS